MFKIEEERGSVEEVEGRHEEGMCGEESRQRREGRVVQRERWVNESFRGVTCKEGWRR